MKIAHTADIHIRGLHYHDEIQYTFERFYDSLIEKKPDVIIIAGDLYHSKLTVTNEYFRICREFLRACAGLASTIVIPGNHDIALNNLSRVDAITPVVESLEEFLDGRAELVYSKDSEKIVLSKWKDFHFYHLSCLDPKEKWTKLKLDSSKINIALYHGSINGCIVDNGWVSRGNKDDLDLFNKYDFGLLGDIHKHQFMTPTIAYPGSIRQNNYGEDIDKGYIFWDINGKDDFSSEFISLPQKRYFFTLFTDSADNVPVDLDLPEDSRILVKTTKAVSTIEEIKIKNKVKRLYKPRNDVPLKAPEESFNVGKLKFGDDLEIDNVRSPEIQKILIEKYFEGNEQVTSEILEKIIDLDKTYHSYIDTDVLRNALWKLESLEWDNLFSYREGNKIDFTKLGGLIGLFGRNRSGKSSIIEALNYTIQNSVNKEGANKSVDYVNCQKEKAEGRAFVSLNNKRYKIERSTERRLTKKGEEKSTNEISFCRILDKDKVKSLNGETKPDTNKNIRNKFGTLEDFNTVSLVSQFGLTNIIDAKATKRKEILSKFLDLGLFDEKYKLANEDAKQIKEKLSEHIDIDYEYEIEKLKEELKEVEFSLQDSKSNRDYLEKMIEVEEEKISTTKGKIKDVSFGWYDFKEAEYEINKIEKKIKDLKIEQRNIVDRIDTIKKELSEDYASQEDVENYLDVLKDEANEFHKIKFALDVDKKAASNLKKIPGVDECRSCPLAHTAYKSQERVLKQKKVLQSLDTNIEEKIEKTQKELSKWKELRTEKTKNVNLKFKLRDLEDSLESLKLEYDQAKEIESTIISNKKHKKELQEFISEKDSTKLKYKEEDVKILNFSKQLGSINEKLSRFKKKKKEVEELREKYYIYQFYLDAMGKDGIAYMIMSQKLPIINKNVNYILSQVIPFQCNIQEDMEERSIKIYLLDDRGKRIVELASGAEKTLIALALRAALWNISSLPKSPILILDEPFGYFDDENYDSVLKLLSHLKTYFKHIIVISHNNDIKVAMDHVIYVEKDEDEFSKVKV